MRIDGFFNWQSLNRDNVLDILSRLNIGDVIKAKVLEITSGELMLKLFDGTVLKAAVASEIDTRPGELLELAVSGKGDGSITLETVKKNIKSESLKNEVKKLLISMDIEPRPENINLAGEFKAAGVKITPAVFEKAADIIRRFSEVNPEKAVFMATKDIQPERGRVGTLIRLLEGSLKLGRQLDELQYAIYSLEKGAAAVSKGARPADIISAPSPAPAQQAVNTGEPVFSEPEVTIIVRNTSKPDQKSVSASEPRPAANTAPIIKQDIAAIAATNEKQGPIAQKPEEPVLTADSRKAVSVGQQQDKTIILPLNDDGFPAVKPDDGQAKETGLKTLRSETENLEKLKEAFKSMFVNTGSEDLKSEIEVKKLYRDLVEKLDTIKGTAMHSGLPGVEEITAKINSLNDGIRLLNLINNSTAYYQIPMNINGFNTTGELYVMKREHSRKRIDSRDVTMFISLDTQNIGRIETVIDIKGKNVGMNLRAEEQGIVDFVKENYKYLYNSLLDKGYRLVDIKYRLIEEETTPVNMDRSIKADLANGRYSVDTRI